LLYEIQVLMLGGKKVERYGLWRKQGKEHGSHKTLHARSKQRFIDRTRKRDKERED